MEKILITTFSQVLLILFITTSCENLCHPGGNKSKTLVQENIRMTEIIDSSIVLDLNNLMEQGSMPYEREVNIQYDHFFNTGKNYRAYSLTKLIKPYLEKLDIDENSASNAVVTFICTDGYKPTLQLSDLLAEEGFIAFCDQDLSEQELCWPDSLESKFSPFYLVWQNVPYDDETFPWPYGLHQIRIDKSNTVYDAIYPYNRPETISGFSNFRDYCIKCHSINKIGGNVGPDFNYPKNITDYWSVDNMYDYAKDPQSFRYNARMSPMTSLTREEFDEIVLYLRYIRTKKLKVETSGKSD